MKPVPRSVNLALAGLFKHRLKCPLIDQREPEALLQSLSADPLAS